MSFAFVDSHVHFWDQSILPYPWLAEVPAIAGRHTPDELRAEAGGRRPDKIVFVECGAPALDEVSWIEQLAMHEPIIAAIVAKTVVNVGDATRTAIHALRQHALVRGVRHLFQDERDPRYCARPEFIAGVQQLAPAQLSFDICCRHHQLAAVVELVQRCPQTRFVLDHAGKPDIRGGVLDPWREHMRQLAGCPNIDCKLSGLITEADHANWSIDDLRPYVEHLLATFGPRRLLFGGDWPVAKLAGEYSRWLDAAVTLTSALSTEERHAVFHANAVRVYRLS